MSSEVIRQLLMNQRRIAGTFAEAAQNPALPEMVRDIFTRSRNDLDAGISYAEQIAAIDASLGIGEKSKQLALAATWLGMDDKVNVAHLRVILEFYDREVLFPEEQKEQLKFQLWALFLKKVPVELFKATGKIEPLCIGVTIGAVNMNIRVHIPDEVGNLTECYITRVSLEYTTAEKYWSVTSVLDRRSVLFHHLKTSANLMVHHHLEDLCYEMTMSTFGYLVDQVVLDKVCGLLDVDRAELKFQPNEAQELKGIDIPKVVLAELSTRQLAINKDIEHQCYSWLMRRMRRGFQITASAIGAVITLEPGRDSWYDYDDYQKAMDDYWVKSSGATWLMVKGVRVAEIEMRPEHRFPVEIVKAVNIAINERIKSLIDEMSVEWNNKPYGAYKEYLETKDGSQADNDAEPTS